MAEDHLYQNGRLAILYNEGDKITAYQKLAERLRIPLHTFIDAGTPQNYFLTWREGCLSLIDKGNSKSGLTVEIEHRPGEQHSWPMPKKGAFAQALGRRTQTIVDATAGWGQDALAMFRMGYEVSCIERSPVVAALLQDGLDRLARLDWVQRLGLSVPTLQTDNAINMLQSLAFTPDCIYLDPIFPPKRKQSALTKKPLRILRELVGDDDDKEQLFAAALQYCGKRVVVKSPDYAEPLGGKPSASFQSKLIRYDVYLK